MGEIFRYTDRDGDYLQVDTRTDHLRFRTGTDDAAHAADVDRHNVLALHAALGEWLFPTAAGTPDTTLLERMVRKAAEDAVTAVLPLYLSGARSRYVDASPAPGLLGATLVESDPEPHDVGHAEDPAEDPVAACGELIRPGQILADVHSCGFLWAVHKAQPEHRGRLMSELPRRTRVRSGPSWDDMLWGENTGGVPPVECTCTHRVSWMHGQGGCNASFCTCVWTGTE